MEYGRGPNTHRDGPASIRPNLGLKAAQLQGEYVRLHEEDQANVRAMEDGEINPLSHDDVMHLYHTGQHIAQRMFGIVIELSWGGGAGAGV